MSHFGLISVTTARRTVSVLDVMMFAVVSAALVTGFAVSVAGGQDALASSYQQAQIYYPVEKPAAAATQEPVAIKPAAPTESNPTIKQLAKSGHGFRSTFGSESIEDKFWLSETHAIDTFMAAGGLPKTPSRHLKVWHFKSNASQNRTSRFPLPKQDQSNASVMDVMRR